MMEATMKLRSALLCLLMLAVAVPAFAQGQLFLNFTDCNDANINRTLNCANTATGAGPVLVASMAPTAVVHAVIADLGYIDVVVGSDPVGMSAFWQFYTNGCAGAARIIFGADFTSNVNCVDVWGGQGSTGGQWGGATGPFPDGNRARVKWTTNVTPDLAFDVPAEKCYVERITLRQTHALTCAGCADMACFVYLSEALSLISGDSYLMTGGTGNGDFVTINDPANATRCPVPTPNRNTTWGQVKSLYR
jgi:hypothetical protein